MKINHDVKEGNSGELLHCHPVTKWNIMKLNQLSILDKNTLLVSMSKLKPFWPLPIFDTVSVTNSVKTERTLPPQKYSPCFFHKHIMTQHFSVSWLTNHALLPRLDCNVENNISPLFCLRDLIGCLLQYHKLWIKHQRFISHPVSDNNHTEYVYWQCLTIFHNKTTI